jgi:hypothetical protein
MVNILGYASTHRAEGVEMKLPASQDPPAIGPIDVATCPGNANVVLLGMIYAAGFSGLGLVGAAGVQTGPSHRGLPSLGTGGDTSVRQLFARQTPKQPESTGANRRTERGPDPPLLAL